jgi:hypothetical protein
MSQYKISKKRLAEIIKEEYQSLQHRKTRRLNEDASDDTFEMVDVIVQALGPQQALEELVQAMERSNAQDLLSYVMRMHDMRMPGDEVEDYDASAYNRKEDEDLEEGYMDALDRSRDDDARERRRQMQRIRDEEERKRQSGGYRRPGAGSGMGGIGGGGSGKKRFAGFNRKDEEGLENPDKADLDDDGKLSKYEKKRGKAIEKSMKKESLDSIRQLIHKELKKL